MPDYLVVLFSLVTMVVAIFLFDTELKRTAFVFALITVGIVAYGVYAFEYFLVNWISMIIFILVLGLLLDKLGKGGSRWGSGGGGSYSGDSYFEDSDGGNGGGGDGGGGNGGGGNGGGGNGGG